MQKQSENDPRILNAKKLFKAAAFLIVFIIGFSIPFFIISSIQENAKNVRIQMDMNQLKLWGESYGIQRNSYKGLDENKEMQSVVNDINSAGGNCFIYINKSFDKYCSETSLSNVKLGKWCVDSAGYVGRGSCSRESYKCY
jgi:hypothetical protein